MSLRTLCLLLLLFFAAPLIAADDQPGEPQHAADDAASDTAPAPAAANATVQVDEPAEQAADAPATDTAAPDTPNADDARPEQSEAPPQTPQVAKTPDSAVILQQRVDALLKDPGTMIDRTAVQNQLDALTSNASQLAAEADDPQVRFDALNVELQSLYTRLVEYPDADDVDHLLSQLRAVARRVKAIELPESGAAAVGDFWLMTAELYDINRTKLPAEARRRQAAMLMKDFLSKHADWAAAMDVREALEQLQSQKDHPAAEPLPAK